MSGSTPGSPSPAKAPTGENDCARRHGQSPHLAAVPAPSARRRQLHRARTPGVAFGRRAADRIEPGPRRDDGKPRSEEHTSELQSLMRISYAGFCLQKKNKILQITHDKKN